METERYTIPFVGNRYCGPAALAYVTRTDPKYAAKVLREVSGRRAIIGVRAYEMTEALKHLGLGYKAMTIADRIVSRRRTNGCRLIPQSLCQWLDTFQPNADEEFIVNVTGHYLVIHGERYYDNGCHLGKPVSACPHLRKRVKNAWRIGRNESQICA